jgi:hypothetical protein
MNGSTLELCDFDVIITQDRETFSDHSLRTSVVNILLSGLDTHVRFNKTIPNTSAPVVRYKTVLRCVQYTLFLAPVCVF